MTLFILFIIFVGSLFYMRYLALGGKGTGYYIDDAEFRLSEYLTGENLK